MVKRDLTKWVYAGTVLLVLVVVLVSVSVGREQNSRWLASYRLYVETQQSLAQGNYDQAYVNYQELLSEPRYAESVTLNWEMARTEAMRGNYGDAAGYYEKVVEIYPAVLADEAFVAEYGQVKEYE